MGTAYRLVWLRLHLPEQVRWRLFQHALRLSSALMVHAICMLKCFQHAAYMSRACCRPKESMLSPQALRLRSGKVHAPRVIHNGRPVGAGGRGSSRAGTMWWRSATRALCTTRHPRAGAPNFTSSLALLL